MLKSTVDSIQSLLYSQRDPASQMVSKLKNQIINLQIDLEEVNFKNRSLDLEVKRLQEEINFCKSHCNVAQ